MLARQRGCRAGADGSDDACASRRRRRRRHRGLSASRAERGQAFRRAGDLGVLRRHADLARRAGVRRAVRHQLARAAQGLGGPPFNDDPTLFALERGTLAFAKAGRRTRTRRRCSSITARTIASRTRAATSRCSARSSAAWTSSTASCRSATRAAASTRSGSGTMAARTWSRCAVKPTMIETATIVP